MHSVWIVYILFITINIVSQSQQMRAKKEEVENLNWKTRTRSPNAHLPLLNCVAYPFHSFSQQILL